MKKIFARSAGLLALITILSLAAGSTQQHAGTVQVLPVLPGSTISRACAASAINQAGYYKGIKLCGKVRVVNYGADIKVKIVNSFPDLRVKVVESFPDDIGEWKFVEYGEDFTVQFVTSFPDITIKYVDSFPGVE